MSFNKLNNQKLRLVDNALPSATLAAKPLAPSQVLKYEDSKGVSQSRLALEGLRKNLKTLNELQARLRFMLTELEDLVIES